MRKLEKQYGKIAKSVALILILFLSLSGFAQKGNTEQKAAIQKLRWMTGNWSGTSTVVTGGSTHTTHIRETVQLSLDGTILQISVRATDLDTVTNRQLLAYTSFSVISYDVKNKKYRWTSWRTNGRDYEQEPFTVGNRSFEYESGEDGKPIRYQAHLGTNGEFLEEGSYSKDGLLWTPFITMRLIKSK